MEGIYITRVDYRIECTYVPASLSHLTDRAFIPLCKAKPARNGGMCKGWSCLEIAGANLGIDRGTHLPSTVRTKVRHSVEVRRQSNRISVDATGNKFSGT